MTDTDLTPDLDPGLTRPLGTRVFTETHRGRVTLCFDHARGRSGEVPAVEAFHRLGWDHYWNRASDAQKRRGVYHGTSAGSWVSMPLLAGEDPLTIATAVLTAWLCGDTTALEPFTRQRIDALPPSSDYRRGDDMNVRLRDGRTARVWSYPKRGAIHVRHADGTAEELETLT